MQNPIQKFRQSSIVFEKPGILSEKLKTLTNSNYNRDFNSFYWSFAHVPYLPMFTKGLWDFFILFKTWVICQNQKRSGFYTLTETSFINSSRYK